MRIKTPLILFISLLIFTGCANKIKLEPNKAINDTSKLEPSIHSENTYYYLKKDADFSKYNKIDIPKVDTYVKNKNSLKNGNLLNNISLYFTTKLQKDLKNIIKDERVNKNSLLIESSIILLDLSYDNLEIYQYLPYGLAFTAIKRTTGIEEKKIRTNFVLKILDKKTNETLAIIIEYDITNTKLNNFDELNINNLKPILDKRIIKYKSRFLDLKKGKYEI